MRQPARRRSASRYRPHEALDAAANTIRAVTNGCAIGARPASRQLEYLAVLVARVADAPRLAAGMLGSVPVPQAVWNREIRP